MQILWNWRTLPALRPPDGAPHRARTRWLQVPPQLLDLAAEELPLQRHGLGHEVVAGEAGPRLVVPPVRAS